MNEIRVQSAFFCERAVKLVTGRTVAFGIHASPMLVAKAHVGNLFPLALVALLGSDVTGSHTLDVRVLGLAGNVMAEFTSKVEVGDPKLLSEIVMDGLMAPMDRAGRVVAQIREKGGDWVEVASVGIFIEGGAA